MFCPKCGTNVPEGSKFCETCGTNMQVAAEKAEPQVQAESPAPVAPQPAPKPAPQPVYQPQPQPAYQQPQQQPQPQSPVYPMRPNYPQQPQAPMQPQYPQRPQPAPQNSTYNGMDPREKPMTVGGWLLTMLIMIVPIVNIVMMFVWAFGSNTNRSKKNFFIASLIMAAIGIILSIVFAATIGSMLNGILEQMGGFEDFGGMYNLP